MAAIPLDAPVARRTVLTVVAATGLLVACGESSPQDPAPGNTTAPGTPPAGQPTDSASPSGEALAQASDVPVRGGVIDGQARVVVTQPSDGEFRAFTAVCTHEGCTVSSVSDNTILCGCHGSRFSAETGDVERGPATSPLAEIAVEVQGGSIVRA